MRLCRESIGVVAMAGLLVLAGCSGGLDGGGGVQLSKDGAQSGSVGVSAGGAQDANAFRSNVENGYVPQPTDIEHEGLYHDYYFDTGDGTCEARFCPSYSRAVSPDPLSGETEHYLTVGLNSGLSRDFERPPLDLVVVVDTSGSMSDRMTEYYYDGNDTAAGESVPKMVVAREALAAMLEHLRDEDRLAVVAYDGDARVVQDLRRVGEIDRASLSDRLDRLDADGSTNLAAGMDRARELLSGETEDDRLARAIYVTDAMPNVGTTGEGDLSERLATDAEQGIHATFVGVGVDFNSRLTESLADVRGANYYSVDSASAFRERMTDGFRYMVTPLAYDLEVSVESEAWRVERVYGAPGDDPDEALFRTATLFPSRRDGNRTEGSVILLRLERTGDGDASGPIDLTASYETPAGERRTVRRSVSFADVAGEHYDSTGVRKAVVLTRYANLLRNWAAHERALAADEEPPEVREGVAARPDAALGEWEQPSVDLRVSEPYGERIETVLTYLREERAALGTDRLARDVTVLETLLNRTAPDESASGTDGDGDGDGDGNEAATLDAVGEARAVG